jgi:phosphatidylglycerol:prolipoprotein diacylglycerol transferase
MGVTIPVYGVSLVLAAIAAWFLIMTLSKLKGLISGDASFAYLMGICGGVIGAYALRPIMRSVEVALSWEQYKIIPVGGLLNYMFGEVVFYGGLIGGLVSLLLFCRSFNIKTAPLLDLFAPALALAHAIGRLGCYFAGCCYGIEVNHNHALSVTYPHTSLGAPPNVPLLAVPLIESALLFVLCVALSVIYIISKRSGFTAMLYLLVYPAIRFTLEFYRGDTERGIFGLLSTSQYISIVMVAFGITYYAIASRKVI